MRRANYQGRDVHVDSNRVCTIYLPYGRVVSFLHKYQLPHFGVYKVTWLIFRALSSHKTKYIRFLFGTVIETNHPDV
jgi:hypothetical protein